jgi:hypothetical protein
MSGLDGLGWPNPEDEPKPKTMNDTPETDGEWNRISCYDHPQFEQGIAEFARKLERERDEAREQRDAVTLRLGNTQERMFDAEMQRDRLAEALRKAISWGDSASHHILHRQNINWTYLNEAKKALQSLTP